MEKDSDLLKPLHARNLYLHLKDGGLWRIFEAYSEKTNTVFLMNKNFVVGRNGVEEVQYVISRFNGFHANDLNLGGANYDQVRNEFFKYVKLRNKELGPFKIWDANLNDFVVK